MVEIYRIKFKDEDGEDYTIDHIKCKSCNIYENVMWSVQCNRCKNVFCEQCVDVSNESNKNYCRICSPTEFTNVRDIKSKHIEIIQVRSGTMLHKKIKKIFEKYDETVI